VIVPTYNRTPTLTQRCLPSIRYQMVRDIEILVVGEGTETATENAMAIAQAYDPRLRFWNLPRPEYPADHQGAWWRSGVVAKNAALDWARGEWVSVLDDDDAYEPDNLAVLLHHAAETGADFVYGMSMTYKDGRPTGQTYGEWPPREGGFCTGAFLYRRELDYRYDWNAPDRGRPSEGDLWERMLADGVRFAFLPRIVHQYHRNFP
jgi:glycosyltransferase involved in cell wall biosynthesis